MTAVQQTPAPAAEERGIPFGRLVAVEWRKAVDTRAGRWLLIITGLFILIAMSLMLLILSLEDMRVGHDTWFENMTIPVSLLVPVFAVLVVTSEWGQRTALVTFALEPHRARVILAKFVVVLMLAGATMLTAFVCSSVGNVLAAAITDGTASWELEGSTLFWSVALQMLYFAMTFGLAMLMLSTPGAIAIAYVVSLILPLMVYLPLVFAFDWARDLLPWIDMTYAAMPIMSGQYMWELPADVTGTNYAQLAVAVTIWVVIPLTTGFVRILRAEIK